MTPALILRVVAKHYGYTAEQLKARTRNAHRDRARQIAMYVARKLSKLSYPAIGREFQRDHTSVLPAVKKVAQEVAQCLVLQRDIELITADIAALTDSRLCPHCGEMITPENVAA